MPPVKARMRWAVGSAEEMGEQVDTIERPARLDTSHSLCEGRGRHAASADMAR